MENVFQNAVGREDTDVRQSEAGERKGTDDGERSQRRGKRLVGERGSENGVTRMRAGDGEAWVGRGNGGGDGLGSKKVMK